MKSMKVVAIMLLVWMPMIFAQDKIQGTYTYTYGDKESLVEARQTCKDLAVRDAIESYYVFVESSTGVENYQVKEDIIQSIAAGYLKDLRIVKQEEEGRTITMTVEATVMPDEVQQLVQNLASKDQSESEKQETASTTDDTVSVSQKDHFVEVLSRYENQMDSVDGNWKSGNHDQAIKTLQGIQYYLEKNKPQQTKGFWATLYQCVTVRMDIVHGLVRVDQLEKQGKRKRVKARMIQINKKAMTLKSDINQLKTFSNLNQKQVAIRKTTINQCRKTIDRVKIKTAEIKRQ